jgi:hypothetical protein
LIRASTASVTSTGETCFDRMAAARSVAGIVHNASPVSLAVAASSFAFVICWLRSQLPPGGVDCRIALRRQAAARTSLSLSIGPQACSSKLSLAFCARHEFVDIDNSYPRPDKVRRRRRARLERRLKSVAASRNQSGMLPYQDVLADA